MTVPRQGDYVDNFRVCDPHCHVSDLALTFTGADLKFVRKDGYLVLPYTGPVPSYMLHNLEIKYTSVEDTVLMYDAWLTTPELRDHAVDINVELVHRTHVVEIQCENGVTSTRIRPTETQTKAAVRI